MSRLYKVGISVKGKDKNWVTNPVDVEDALERWGMDIRNEWRSYDNTFDFEWDGGITLSGGEDERQAHSRLRTLLPKYYIQTRWLYDERDWDEVIDDEREHELGGKDV